MVLVVVLVVVVLVVVVLVVVPVVVLVVVPVVALAAVDVGDEEPGEVVAGDVRAGLAAGAPLQPASVTTSTIQARVGRAAVRMGATLRRAAHKRLVAGEVEA